ncbi:MAG TPA: hypothetical protein VKX49_07755 [Bryobacteraceae bacterium]|nr:hypothetical protein [Bryobacteraceae bacterium]
MRCRLYVTVLVLSIAAFAQISLDPDTGKQKQILADATEYALNHEQLLPNFICTQTTQRFVDFTGKSGYRSVDLIVERLTYFDHKEDYKVFMVNGEASNLSHHDLGGAISSGEFGSVMKGIFWPDANTQFNWERFYKLRGRRMNVYSYRVEASKSDYHIVVPVKKLDLVTAYHGLVFIDDEKHYVHRITLHADGIPADFPVQEVGLVLDYDYTRIGDSEYLLPLEFELRSREGVRLIKNDVTYDGYRKFGSDSTITFDSPAAGSRPSQ